MHNREDLDSVPYTYESDVVPRASDPALEHAARVTAAC